MGNDKDMGSTRPDGDWGTTHPGEPGRYPGMYPGDRYPTSPIPGSPGYDRYNPDPYDRDRYGPGGAGYDSKFIMKKFFKIVLKIFLN